ncbi:ATP-dependent DNA helicase II subunit 1 [Exophiala xenobiotica]|nr:ATP-dependent DNA helicase II subunit 1 [Exophiala xenobiotica]
MADLPYRPKAEDDPVRNEEDEEDEEEIDESGYKTVKDAVLFAIEVSESMLKRPQTSGSRKSDNTSPLLAALKCAYHLMQQRIISTPRDLMGILLYGTEATKFYDEDENSRGGWSFPHCYLLTDLDVPEASAVKALKELTEADSPESNELFRPSKEPVSMHNVLFCANQVFQQKAANFTSRRLFIVTDNDDPHSTNKDTRSQATVRAKDLYDLGVIIELFPISTPEHAFDTKLFYDDIIYKASPSDPDAIAYNPSAIIDTDGSKLSAGSNDGISLLQSLLSNIASKVSPKRALFSSVPLELGPGLEISVKGYLLYKHQKPARSSYIYLGSERPQIVTGRTTQVTDNTQPVEKAEIRKAYTFGGEQITFTVQEAQELRNFGKPVIKVIGFKPMSRLPLWANLKNSTFLYPSEEHIVGSTRVYSALHRKLSKDKLFGLTWFVPRKNATPVMAAMIPTLSAEGTDGKSNAAGVSSTGAPQGLHLIPLPFADDIRSNPPTTRQEPLHAPDELVDAMRPIILTEQLNLPKGIYDPSKYPNPSLQWHYRILQTLALDDEIPDKPEDKTVPKYRQIDKRVGNEAVEWGKTLEKAFKEFHIENPDSISTGSKRYANGQSSSAHASTKKVKTEGGDGITEEEVRNLWQKGKLSSLTVAQLKEICGPKKISIAGKKADLIDRLESWLESK